MTDSRSVRGFSRSPDANFVRNFVLVRLSPTVPSRKHIDDLDARIRTSREACLVVKEWELLTRCFETKSRTLAYEFPCRVGSGRARC